MAFLSTKILIIDVFHHFRDEAGSNRCADRPRQLQELHMETTVGQAKEKPGNGSVA